MKELTQSDYEEMVGNSEGIVVIDFWAEWCGPCKVALPKLEALSEDFGDDVAFYKVNVDDEGALAAQFSVRSIPTFVVLVDGDVNETIIANVGELKDHLENLV
jgi:thioredoxin 1